MTRIIIAALVAISIFASPWGAPFNGAQAAMCGTLYPADPAKLATSLEPLFDRLDNGVPSLSPREEQWLDEELASGDDQRWLKASNSVENAQLWVKRNTTSLAVSIRILTGTLIPSTQQMTPRERWRYVAYYLIDTDATIRLARLVTMGVIAEDAIPRSWKLFADADSGYPLSRAIRDARALLAQHILLCTLGLIE
jgi:hypothetical protein